MEEQVAEPTPQELELQAFEQFHGAQLTALGVPRSLFKKVFTKCKFEDFDIGEKVQMLLDEGDARMYLRTLKELKAEDDLWLVDHVWTFKQRVIYQQLCESEKLRDRLEGLMKYSEKRELPGEDPYAKKRPTLEEYLKMQAESTEPVLEYDLDDYDIKSLKGITFRPEVEQISLWNNQILDPNDVTKVLMALPNLRAVWLNNNPVCTNCSNFNVVGDHFDKLEIFNSQLTCKAGEWAMLFYAKESGAKTLQEITSLGLAGKNTLLISDLSFFKQMTNLKKLDISDNVDMYKPKEMLAEEARKLAEGSGQDFDFMENKHCRDALLECLPALTDLTCDLMLEMYIVDTIGHRDYLPNLKTINRVSVKVTDLGERTKEKKVLELMDKMWRYVGQYRLVKPGVMDEDPTFYINDEVGAAISHSDQPNSKMVPFIYSPGNSGDDPNVTTVSLLWATKDIPQSEYVYRDFLSGVTEERFRSARLYPWFDVYEQYYEAEHKKYLALEPPFDALKRHQEYQAEYPPQAIIDWDVATQGPIPVYTDYIRVKEFLTDPRFRLVDDHKEAKIFWLTSEYEEKLFLEWGYDESQVYVSWYKKDGALCIKSHIAHTINTTYALKDRHCI